MRASLVAATSFLLCFVACSSGSSGNTKGDGGAEGGGDGAMGCMQTMCGSACADLSTDMQNCGFCGNACGSYQTCKSGQCTSSMTCAPPPGGISAQAAAAYTTENTARAAMGIPCAEIVPALDTSATDHCNYYVANFSNQAMCESDPHVEVMGCSMYVAAQFYDREKAAGYKGLQAFEDMAFVDNGQESTQQFIDSVWHRIPILSPWVRDMGYGAAMGSAGCGSFDCCDTIDFGVGPMTPDGVTAVYPYPGQIGVPTLFHGNYEGPPPPMPPAGWPSGYPIIVYLHGAKTATVHTITEAGSTTSLDHQLIQPGDSDSLGLLQDVFGVGDAFILYTNAPFKNATHYHVHIEATVSIGPQTETFDWSFTTM